MATTAKDAAGALRAHMKDPGIPGFIVDGSAWQVQHNPAANTQATVTQAAPGANKRLVVTTARFSSGNTGLLGGAQNLVIEVVASGGSTLYQGRVIHAGAAGNFAQVTLENRTYLAPVNESVTVRFTAAGGANTFESVAMTGYTVDVS